MAYRGEFDRVVALLQEAETLAHSSGLHATAHAINAAKNRAGWEFAGVEPPADNERHLSSWRSVKASADSAIRRLASGPDNGAKP